MERIVLNGHNLTIKDLVKVARENAQVEIAQESRDEINEILRENGVLGGFDLKKIKDDYDHGMLIAVTENRTLEEIDHFVKIMEEI